MNKFVLSALVINVGSLIAQEEISPAELLQQEPVKFHSYEQISQSPHQLFPRFFFKKHREGGYQYDMFGFGVGYNYKKDQGLNFKCSVSTNLDGSKPYVEEDFNFSYIINSLDKLSLSPFLASKNATHQINKIDDVKYIVTKGTLSLGVGIKPQLMENFEGEIKLGLSRDLYNVLLHSTEDNFIGRKFSNPFGFLGEINVGYKVIDILNLALDLSYARGFKGEFRNCGAGLAANWSF